MAGQEKSSQLSRSLARWVSRRAAPSVEAGSSLARSRCRRGTEAEIARRAIRTWPLRLAPGAASRAYLARSSAALMRCTAWMPDSSRCASLVTRLATARGVSAGVKPRP